MKKSLKDTIKEVKEAKEVIDAVEETAVTIASDEVSADVQKGDAKVDKDPRQTKQSLFKTISGVMNIIPTVQDAYTSWVKPIYDNRAQISRRLSAVSTAISIIFFMLYIPFLLLGKLYKDLALGLDIAIYVCIGIYIATLVALFIVSIASGKSTSTAMAKRHKKTRKIILFIVRIASLAIAITALVISATNGSKNATGATLDTIAIIFAVMSIIFSAFPLIFGGMAGFLRWLISPAKAKYKFSFVLLEWYQSLTSDKIISKTLKKSIKKYGEKIGAIIDNYFLPQLGKKLIKSVDQAALRKMLDIIPPEDLNIAEWIIKEVFDYAEECGYIDLNPCKQLELGGNIELEGKPKKAADAAEKREKKKEKKDKKSPMETLSSLFNRKPKDE